MYPVAMLGSPSKARVKSAAASGSKRSWVWMYPATSGKSLSFGISGWYLFTMAWDSL